MQALTDDSVMAFGKHKGERLENVPARYLLWLWDDGWHARTAALMKDCPDYVPTHQPSAGGKK